MPDRKKVTARKKPVAHAAEKTLLEVPDIASLLGTSKDVVYGMVKKGTIPHIVIGNGKLIRFHPQTIQRWLLAGCPKDFSADQLDLQTA
jgi:excisionase family DNA binding protein